MGLNNTIAGLPKDRVFGRSAIVIGEFSENLFHLTRSLQEAGQT